MERGNRKVRVGVVLTDKSDKTRVVKISRKIRHSLYGKVLKRSSKFHVHDEKNESKIGDEIKIVETKPVSKLKKWRMVEVLKKA